MMPLYVMISSSDSCGVWCLISVWPLARSPRMSLSANVVPPMLWFVCTPPLDPFALLPPSPPLSREPPPPKPNRRPGLDLREEFVAPLALLSVMLMSGMSPW